MDVNRSSSANAALDISSAPNKLTAEKVKDRVRVRVEECVVFQ